MWRSVENNVAQMLHIHLFVTLSVDLHRDPGVNFR